MEITRTQWLKKLKNLLECPVCYEIPKKIFFCSMGHNMCEVCKTRIHECPVCKKDHLNVRNFFAEHVSLMFEDIKKDIANENFDMIDVTKIKLQDDLDSFSALGKAINRSWGLFPCYLSPECVFKGCYSEIIEHFEKKHKDQYAKILDGKMPLKRTWNILYENKKSTTNKAFYVENKGLFIFHTNNNEQGDLRVLILMYSSTSVAKKFSYRMQVQSDSGSWSIKTIKLFTTRTPLDIVYQGSLTITRKAILANEVDKSVPLKCSVILKQQILR